MSLLVKNIAKIVGIETSGRLRVCGEEMDRVETLDNGWLTADNGRITGFGTSDSQPDESLFDRVVDAQGGMLYPSFCDSHTHIVYAGSREQEFLDKINGLSYEQIAKRGGGILNSADRLHETSEDELYAQAMQRVREVALMGTGAIEIKSGYGLSTEDELKMLRVIRRIKESMPMKVKATFLGAHAVARQYIGRQAEYVNMVVPIQVVSLLLAINEFQNCPEIDQESGAAIRISSDLCDAENFCNINYDEDRRMYISVCGNNDDFDIYMDDLDFSELISDLDS